MAQAQIMTRTRDWLVLTLCILILGIEIHGQIPVNSSLSSSPVITTVPSTTETTTKITNTTETFPSPVPSAIILNVTADPVNSAKSSARKGKSSIFSIGNERRSSPGRKLSDQILLQIELMDPLRCLPKALCGLSAASQKNYARKARDIVDDYMDILRSILTRDDSDEEKRNKDVIGKIKGKPRNAFEVAKDEDPDVVLHPDLYRQQIQKEESEEDDDEEDDSSGGGDSDEDDDGPRSRFDPTGPQGSSEWYTREKAEVEAMMATTESPIPIHWDDPDSLGYALSYSYYDFGGPIRSKKTSSSKPSRKPRQEDVIHSTRYNFGFTSPSVYESNPYGYGYGWYEPEPETEPSSLQNFLNTWLGIGIQFSGPKQKDIFADDPFFDGFKRSGGDSINYFQSGRSTGAAQGRSLHITGKIYNRNPNVSKKERNDMVFTPEQEEAVRLLLPRLPTLSHRILSRRAGDDDGTEDDYMKTARVRLRSALELGKVFDTPEDCDAVYDSCPFSYGEVAQIIDHYKEKMSSQESPEEEGGSKRPYRKPRPTLYSMDEHKRKKSKKPTVLEQVSKFVKTEVLGIDDKHENAAWTRPKPKRKIKGVGVRSNEVVKGNRLGHVKSRRRSTTTPATTPPPKITSSSLSTSQRTTVRSTPMPKRVTPSLYVQKQSSSGPILTVGKGQKPKYTVRKKQKIVTRQPGRDPVFPRT